jgi:hypothetical protein
MMESANAVTMYLRATVSYSDADGSGKTSMMVSANAVTDETDMDEPGTVTLSEMQPMVGTELTATLTAPVGGVCRPCRRRHRRNVAVGQF